MAKATKALILIVIVLAVAGYVYRYEIRDAVDSMRGVTPQQRAQIELITLKPSQKDIAEDPVSVATKALTYAREAAVATTTIYMKGCTPDTVTAKVKYGETVSFRNTGASIISISIAKTEYALPEGGELKLRSDQMIKGLDPKAFTAVGYMCDGATRPTGYVYIAN